ncbi:hypothetical protein, partial [Lysinibacillus sp. NPDC086135]|uniref:hypothetical protein n=1 Tax=Lysinibacillus sp. NPDC086135 TaxID=3364130 RepID=UPI003830E98B
VTLRFRTEKLVAAAALHYAFAQKNLLLPLRYTALSHRKTCCCRCVTLRFRTEKLVAAAALHCAFAQKNLLLPQRYTALSHRATLPGDVR